MARVKGGALRRVTARSALLFGTALSALPGFAVAQTIQQAGPGVEVGPYYVMNGADLPAPGQPTNVPPRYATQSGAIQALAYDPANPNILLAASPNGGVFRSTNGGASWTATTDNQGSLSIASLNFDPTDATGNTVIAGVGLTSSGATFAFNPYFNQSRGGVLDGLLVSNNAGASWTNLGANLPPISMESVSIRGSVVMAAAFNEEGSWTSNSGVEAGSGLYRSTDGGHTFTQVAGLPSGAAASALVGDPSNPNRFYVAVTDGGANKTATSVWTTTNGGQSWTQVFSAANSAGTINSSDPTMLRLAAGPNGSVAIAVVDGASGTVTGLFLSKNNGSTWNNLSIALTPGSPNGTGQEDGSGFGNQVDTGGKNPVGAAFTYVVADNGYADLSVNPGGQASIHSVIAIDPNNPNIVYLAGDRQNLPSPTGAVTYSGAALQATLNGDGTVTYSAITDNYTGDHSTYHPDTRAMTFAPNGSLVVGSDGGVYTRSNPSSSAGVWRGLNVGRQALEIYDLSLDPHTGLIAVAAQDNGTAIQSNTNPAIYRQVAGGDGTIAPVNGVTDPNSSWTYVGCQYLCGGPTRIQTDLHGNFTNATPVDVYFSVDGSAAGIIGIDSSDVIFTQKLRLNNIDPTYMALGVQPGVILAQDNVLTPSTSYASSPLFGYSGPGAYTILTLNFAGYTGFNQALDFGTRDNEFALLAGGTSYGGHRLFFSNAPDYADVWLQPVLSYHGFAPTAVLFDPRSQNRFFATDTNSLYGTTNGGATGNDLTSFLPAHFIRPQSLAFVSTNGVNALLVGGLNDTANVGSPLVVADSDASGNLSGWRRFGVGLPNADVTVLDYVSSLDELAIGTFGRGAFVMYDVTSNFSSASVLQFGLANNDSNPDASLLVGNRPLIKYGTGTLTINGAAAYTGGTDIKAGGFVLNGSIINNALVEAPATMSGTGFVGGKLTVNGALNPGVAGAGTGVLNVGSFVAGPGSVFQVQYGASASNALMVNTTANITGMTLQVQALPGAGAVFDQKYAILTSFGLTGQFTNAAGFSTDAGNSALRDRIRYDLQPNGVVLEVVHPVDWTQNAGNANQRAVGQVLNATQLTGSDAWLNALNGPFNGGSPSAQSLSQLSGEGGVNLTRGAQLVGGQFMSLLGDHLAGSAGAEGGALRLARNNLTSATSSAVSLSDVADSATAAAAGSAELHTTSVWSDAYVVSQRLSGDASDVKAMATGFAAGFERRIDEHTKFGAAVGYAQAKADTNAVLTTSKGDYVNGAIYASRKAGPWFVGGIVSYSSGNPREDRTLAIVGGPSFHVTGSTTDTNFQASLMAGRAFKLGPATHLTASGSLTFSNTDQHAFTESGAGVFSLQYNAIKRNNVLTDLGLKLDHTYRLSGGAKATPYIGVSETFLEGDRTMSAQAAFTGAPTTPFITQGDSLPRAWTNTKAGLKFKPNDRWTVDLRYQGAYGGHLKEDAAVAHISFAF